MSDLERFAKMIDEFVPGISMDCVLFGYKDRALHVLLLKWKNTNAWSLPGGFLKNDEEMEEAVTRVLFERTGIDNIFLKQFYTFSGLKRNWNDNELSNMNYDLVFGSLDDQLKEKVSSWFSQRFISTGFLALVDINHVNLNPDYLSERCEWISVNDLPQLVLDHNRIIEMALEKLKVQMNFLPVGRSLLPDKFTMKDLQSLYEAILQKPLDRGNFQRKILALNMLNRHEKHMTGAANKAPYLYSFNNKAYRKLLEAGIGLTLN